MRRLAMPEIMQSLLDPKSPLAPMLGEGAMADDDGGRVRGIAAAGAAQAINAGVPVLAGSDAGNPVTFHGISLIRELELLAQAGMPLTDVLKAATSRAADRLGQSTLGRISAECGGRSRACSTPIRPKTSRAYRRVASVYLGGRKFDLVPDPVPDPE